MRIITFLIAVFTAVGACAESVAINNVKIVPMTSETVSEGSVVSEDGAFTVVTEGAAEADIVIDGEGGYLIPALGDMHIHFFGGSKALEPILNMHMSQGIGYGLCMGGSRRLLGTRDDIASGKLQGPTLFIGSPIIGNFRPHPPNYETGVELVQEYKAEGYDWLKVYNEIPAEGYRGVMEEAKRLGMPVVGHAVRSVMIEGAIKNNQDIAHVEEFIYGYFNEGQDESRIPELAKRIKAADISVVTTLIAYRNIFLQVEDLEGMLASPGVADLPDSITNSWQRDRNDYIARFDLDHAKNELRPTYEFMKKIVKGLHDQGVRLVAGTDAPIPLVAPGYSLHTELEELVASGLTPYEALKTATVNVAEFLGKTDSQGTIEVGKDASAVLLEKNPLDDISNTQTIRGVLIRGRWYDAKALAALAKGASE